MGQPGQGYAWSLPPEHIGRGEVSEGTETSKYLEARGIPWEAGETTLQG